MTEAAFVNYLFGKRQCDKTFVTLPKLSTYKTSTKFAIFIRLIAH